MTPDQLGVVLQPDDQLVKIKTVIRIDDHSNGEQAGVGQDLKADKRISALIHCDGMTGSQRRGEVATMLAVVTIMYELLESRRPDQLRSQSLNDSSGMTQCVIVRVRHLGTRANHS
jgi:hypothetical protein